MWAVYFLLIILIFWGTLRVLDLHNRYMRLVLTQPGLLNDVRPQPKEETNSDGSGKEFVDAATRAVIEHLSESDFSIDDLCREMGMSRTYLYMRLKTYTGKSPQDFIRVIRMERAAWLLREGHSVADVSVQVGFDNPKYFSTVFKKYFDVSPSKYR
jgi:AraC-like DNA-binding protein